MLISTRVIWICRLALFLIAIIIPKSNGNKTEGARLLVAEHGNINILNLKSPEHERIAYNIGGSTGIDYDFVRRLIIWSDATNDIIFSMDMSGAKKKIIAENYIMGPSWVSVDWIYGNVYWTDNGEDVINVASIDGNLRKVLISEDLDEPRAIVLNPLEGWMFWSDWGDSPKIERSGMDGSHRSTIVSEDILWPNGLSLDTDSRKIYWIDADWDNLKRADYDGSNVEFIIRSSPRTAIERPFGLDIFEDWVYWSDWSTGSIYKADKVTGENEQVIASGFYYPMSIRVLHSSKQPKGTNYCEESGVCSHWCLPAPIISGDLRKFTCACPNGMVLMDNQKNCTIEAED